MNRYAKWNLYNYVHNTRIQVKAVQQHLFGVICLNVSNYILVNTN